MPRKKPTPHPNGQRPTPPPAVPAMPDEEALDPALELFPEISHRTKRAFLAAFMTCGSRTRAAEQVGIDRRSHHYWLIKDEQYRDAFARAEAMCGPLIEDEIMRRGYEGVDKGVWHNGVLVGTERVYSDTLLIFAAKGAMPQKYRDNVVMEHTLSPALMALQQQWQQAAQQVAPPALPDQAPIEAEYTEMAQDDHQSAKKQSCNSCNFVLGSDTPPAQPPGQAWQLQPQAPLPASDAHIFDLLDAINQRPDDDLGDTDDQEGC